VQTFMPTPMAMATTMYHSRKNPLKKVTADSEVVETARSGKVRKAHKAFLRYYDPENWPILRETLVKMGRADLIGNGEKHLIPSWTAGEENLKAAPEGKRAMPMAAPGAKPRSAATVPGVRGARAVVAAPAATGRGGRANALTGSLTARESVETKVRASILDTIKVKAKPAPAPAKGARPSAPARGRK
jgi:hypothetical protein